jgi:hypothetical protein
MQRHRTGHRIGAAHERLVAERRVDVGRGVGATDGSSARCIDC